MKIEPVKILLIFVIISFMFSSCKECDPSSEPTVEVDFFDNSTESQIDPPYKSIHGVGNDNKIYADLSSKPFHYNLPLALNSNSVSFILENEERTDTITFNYKRNPYFQSSECGYVIEFSDFEVKSTFEKYHFFTEGGGYTGDKRTFFLDIYIKN